MVERNHEPAARPLVKTKIIATVGPACESQEQLTKLVLAGANVFRLNFAHGDHAWLSQILRHIRAISAELGCPIGVLGDLAGPKIRLGELPDDQLRLTEGDRVDFVRKVNSNPGIQLTTTYDGLVEDVQVGDQVLLADGTVRLIVVAKSVNGDAFIGEVAHGGTIRSRQGVNLPGAHLNLSSLTEKDLEDLTWAIDNELDFIGFSFVRSPNDIRQLKAEIAERQPKTTPQIVAKIEKMEAVAELDEILGETDAVMVARGDLGVEVDIARVPILQKRIIRLCNQHRIPVITATQMLESMHTSERPTRAEASDVANAVLDGSDATMLSGETAIGEYPVKAVAMMSRIAYEAERLVTRNKHGDPYSTDRSRARLVTEAVTLGASTAAEHLEADLIAVATHSGRTAMAVSKQRSPVPVLAMTDSPESARRMCLLWGVTPMQTDAVHNSPEELLKVAIEWGKRHDLLKSGSRVVLVGSTDWSQEGHNLLLVHAVP